MLKTESEGDDVEDMEEEEPSPAATVTKQNSPTTKVLYAQYCPIRVCTVYQQTVVTISVEYNFVCGYLKLLIFF